MVATISAVAPPIPRPDAVPWAQAGQKVYQIPTSLALAAFGIESDWGKAEPPGSNNGFGRKALPGEPSVSSGTKEQIGNGSVINIVAGFKVYASPADAFMDYAKLLGLGRPYHNMVTTFLQSSRGIEDVRALARSLQGVYATSHTYGAALIAMMDRYDLYQYDKAPIPKVEASTLVAAYLKSARSAADGQALLDALNKEYPMTDITTTSATPTSPARVVPSATQPVRVPWGDWAAQFLAHEAPIIEALAQGGITLAAGAAGPMGPIISAFIGPTVIKQYVDQGLAAAEHILNPQSLTISDTGTVTGIIANLLNQNEPALMEFLGKEVDPIIKGLLSKLGFPAA